MAGTAEAITISTAARPRQLQTEAGTARPARRQRCPTRRLPLLAGRPSPQLARPLVFILPTARRPTGPGPPGRTSAASTQQCSPPEADPLGHPSPLLAVGAEEAREVVGIPGRATSRLPSLSATRIEAESSASSATSSPTRSLSTRTTGVSGPSLQGASTASTWTHFS